MKRKKILSLLTACTVALSCIFTFSPSSLANEQTDISSLLTQPSQEFQDYLELSPEEQQQQLPPSPLDRPSVLEGDTQSLKKVTDLPARYDAREGGYLSPVLDQANTNTCWTYSALENLASFLNRKEGKTTDTSYIYSPRHMEFSTCIIPNDFSTGWTYYRSADTGGNQLYSSAYLLGGVGPVDNTGAMETHPYETNSNGSTVIDYPTRKETLQSASAQVNDYLFYPAFDSSNKDASREYLKALMKQGVMEYGSLDVGYYHVYGNEYYNEENSAFYCPNNVSTMVNHAVLLVGWDDNFPKENFNAGHRPESDGAWIIQNSWGEGFGENGYFYISYEDESIYNLTTTVTDASSSVNYDTSYVLDPLGMTGSLQAPSNNYEVWAANIFTKEAGTEKLESINLGLWGQAKYEVYVTDGSLDVSGLSPVATGSTDWAGFFQVDLNREVLITGKKFGVVVKFILSNDSEVMLEQQVPNTPYANAYAPAGSSYAKVPGSTWTELSSSYYHYANFCIKAFTSDVSGKTTVSFVTDTAKSLCNVYRTDKSGVIMQPDGTYSLSQNTKYVYEHLTTAQDRYMNAFTTSDNTSETVYTERPTLPFTDITPFDWYYDSVDYVYENALMSGVSASRFSPSATANRAMLVTVLWRMEGSPTVSENTGFTDVPAGEWYSQAVAWAKQAGVVDGVSATRFAPTASITREQFATILYRYRKNVQQKPVTASGNLSVFTDRNQISSYATEGITWCVGEKILNGRSATQLSPKGNLKRSECAAMLQRLDLLP